MVSVVVIGRNEGPGLADCLASVRDALGAVPHELLYVDSHSADGSLALALAGGARCYRLRTADTTAAMARRAGTLEARGETVLFLDGDMRLVPGFVETALPLLTSGDWAGAAGIRHDVYLRDGRAVGENPNYYGCMAQREAPEFGGAVMLRRQALLEAGNWAAPVLTCEEAELHARLSHHGLRVVELPVPMIRHMDQVRDQRGAWRVLCSARRLGLGQALRHAARAGTLPALLRREKLSFALWGVDALCALACCFGWAGAAALGVQAAQLALFAARRRARGFVGQKLLFFYLPAGVLSYRTRDVRYDAVTDAASAQTDAAPR